MVQAHPNVMSTEHHLGFLQREAAQTVLPFATSLVLHAGIIAIGLLTYRAVTVIRGFHTELAGPVSSDFEQPNPLAPIGQLALAGIGNDAQPRSQNIEMFDIDANSSKFKPGSARDVNLNPGGSEEINANSLIGFGNRTGTATGPGLDNGPGSGEAPGGRWGRYSAQPSDGQPVFVPPNARKIVYVCDATGSMQPVFSGLRRELAGAIDRLGQNSDVQFFNVIFFSDERVMSLSPTLLKADPAAKNRAVAFVNDATPRGLTNPLPAIRAAFAQKPEVIYVLTDGFDQVSDPKTVVQEFNTLNKDHSVRVNTILIGSTEQKELVETLQTIAEQNHGTMKIVSKDDF